MDPDHVPVELDQIPVFMPPRIGPPVTGVGPAGHAGLVSVIKRRCAGQRKEHHDTFAERRIG